MRAGSATPEQVRRYKAAVVRWLTAFSSGAPDPAARRELGRAALALADAGCWAEFVASLRRQAVREWRRGA